MRWLLVALLACGCDKLFLGDPRDPCVGQAGPNDAGLFRYCVALPAEDRMLSDTLDTNVDCDEVVGSFCVVTGLRITVGSLAMAGGLGMAGGGGGGGGGSVGFIRSSTR